MRTILFSKKYLRRKLVLFTPVITAILHFYWNKSQVYKSNYTYEETYPVSTERSKFIPPRQPKYTRPVLSGIQNEVYDINDFRGFVEMHRNREKKIWMPKLDKPLPKDELKTAEEAEYIRIHGLFTGIFDKAKRVVDWVKDSTSGIRSKIEKIKTAHGFVCGTKNFFVDNFKLTKEAFKEARKQTAEYFTDKNPKSLYNRARNYLFNNKINPDEGPIITHPWKFWSWLTGNLPKDAAKKTSGSEPIEGKAILDSQPSSNKVVSVDKNDPVMTNSKLYFIREKVADLIKMIYGWLPKKVKSIGSIFKRDTSKNKAISSSKAEEGENNISLDAEVIEKILLDELDNPNLESIFDLDDDKLIIDNNKDVSCPKDDVLTKTSDTNVNDDDISNDVKNFNKSNNIEEVEEIDPIRVNENVSAPTKIINFIRAIVRIFSSPFQYASSWWGSSKVQENSGNVESKPEEDVKNNDKINEGDNETKECFISTKAEIDESTLKAEIDESTLKAEIDENTLKASTIKENKSKGKREIARKNLKKSKDAEVKLNKEKEILLISEDKKKNNTNSDQTKKNPAKYSNCRQKSNKFKHQSVINNHPIVV